MDVPLKSRSNKDFIATAFRSIQYWKVMSRDVGRIVLMSSRISLT